MIAGAIIEVGLPPDTDKNGRDKTATTGLIGIVFVFAAIMYKVYKALSG